MFKVGNISEGTDSLHYTYDDSRQRTIADFYKYKALQKSIYYLGDYEKIVSGSNTRQLNYISGGEGLAAICVINNGVDSMYYVHTDHLGSYDVITDQNGTVVQNYSFDAWGRRRNPTDWTYNNVPSSYLFPRGYTGHEHLDAFNLINMNGRVYDPLLGRFMSADNYVQEAGNTQSYNRYSYCMNNPLSYIDPSGYTWFSRLGDWLGGTDRTIATTVVGVAAGAAVAFILGIDVVGIAILGGMMSGAVSGGVGAALNGSDSFDIMACMTQGAIMGGLAGAAGYGVLTGLGALGQGINKLVAKAWTGHSYARFLCKMIEINAKDGFSWVGVFSLPSGIIPNIAMSINGALAGNWGMKMIPAGRISNETIKTGQTISDWYNVSGTTSVNGYVNPSSMNDWYSSIGINNIKVLKIKRVQGEYNTNGTFSQYVLNGIGTGGVNGIGEIPWSDVYGGYSFNISTLQSPNQDSFYGPNILLLNKARVYEKYGPGNNPWWRRMFFGIRY